MPRITIHINAPSEPLDHELLTLDLGSDLPVKDLKALVESETSVPSQFQQFYLNGNPLTDDEQTLGALGMKDGDMLALAVRRPNAQAQPRRNRNQDQAQRRGQPSADEIETIRLQIAGNPALRAQLREQKPELLAAVDNPTRFREQYEMELRQAEEQERERQRNIQSLNEDLFNEETQRKIEEIIRQQNVINNLQHALENNPEVFAKVTMLYINVEVNGHPVKAFVDSGAQATIMSPACAERCNIMRLIDKRYAGIARGVGTAQILGRVHSAEIKVGDAQVDCAFTVMEGKDVELLFGLDMLKRYRAKIDLEKNVLALEGGVEVPFLPESEIPKYLEDAQTNEPTVPGPNGTEIGASSGAIRPAGTSAAASASQGQSDHPSNNIPTPQQTASQFPQSSIDQLQQLGFSKEEAIRALQATGGNVEFAASMLFNL